MYISSKELDANKPNIKTLKTSIFFLNNGNLIKRFTNISVDEKRDYFLHYLFAKQINNVYGFSLPFDILETENGFEGYIEKIVPGTLEGHTTTYANYLKSNANNISLVDITDYILKCCEIVSECHKKNIVNPDMCTAGNVVFNFKNRSVTFLDFQGLQVGNLPASSFSTFLFRDIGMLLNPKYYNDPFFTKEIDFYTLATRYLYYTTTISLPDVFMTSGNINELLNQAGISDTYFGDCIRILHDFNSPNIDIRGAIIELNRDYELAPVVKGQVRRLVKKS